MCILPTENKLQSSKFNQSHLKSSFHKRINEVFVLGLSELVRHLKCHHFCSLQFNFILNIHIFHSFLFHRLLILLNTYLLFISNSSDINESFNELSTHLFLGLLAFRALTRLLLLVSQKIAS